MIIYYYIQYYNTIYWLISEFSWIRAATNYRAIQIKNIKATCLSKFINRVHAVFIDLVSCSWTSCMFEN